MDCYIALGSNVGDRGFYLAAGLDGLRRAGLSPAAVSSVWETEPVGLDDPRWFWNMAVKTHGHEEPLAVLERLLEIEQASGRTRRSRNDSRTLDLDLLLWGDRRIDDPRLQLPHPRMWRRRFVLAPLAEIGPRLRNPATGRLVDDECRRLKNGGAVRKLGRLAPRGAILL